MIVAQLENVSLKIAGEKIVEHISLQLSQGKITTLIGPNGGGKTSIARLILGIVKPTSGKVLLGPKIKIGYMPQKIEIDKSIPLSARDFIKLLTKIDKINEELAERLGVKKILHRQIQDLSGGQLQKILFLQAVSNNPDLLVLDEPTQYMDFNAIQDFYKIIEDLRQTTNCSILLISHDLTTVMQKCDFVFCVNNHVCCHGSPEDVDKHPEYISLFGNKSNLAIYQHHHNHQH